MYSQLFSVPIEKNSFYICLFVIKQSIFQPTMIVFVEETIRSISEMRYFLNKYVWVAKEVNVNDFAMFAKTIINLGSRPITEARSWELNFLNSVLKMKKGIYCSVQLSSQAIQFRTIVNIHFWFWLKIMLYTNVIGKHFLLRNPSIFNWGESCLLLLYNDIMIMIVGNNVFLNSNAKNNYQDGYS